MSIMMCEECDRMIDTDKYPECFVKVRNVERCLCRFCVENYPEDDVKSIYDD